MEFEISKENITEPSVPTIPEILPIPRFTLKGWNFGTWITRNKESLKLIVSGVAGLITTFTVNLKPTLAFAVGGLVMAVSKVAIDTLDYWQSD